MAHLHEVRDTDTHYVIDPITMEITNPNEAKNKLMQGDHNSEIYTFEIPKVIEGHDMSKCNKIEVHYINIGADRTNRSEDVYPVVDMATENDTLVFSWKVSGNATMYAGTLNFRIKFACVDENGNDTYRKWTEVYKGITVSDGFDNGEAVVAEYSDILEQWRRTLVEAAGDAANAVLYTEQTLTTEQQAQALENIGAVTTPKKQFKNIRFGFIGDSQTERNWHKTVLWQEQLTDHIGIFNSRGLSSFTIAKNAGNYGMNFSMLAPLLSKAVDAVLVMGGINDVWYNSPLGEFGSTDNTTVYGAMDELCSALIDKYPAKTIVFITPTEQNNPECTAANTTGTTAADIAKAMKEVCAKYAIPVYDANALSGIYPLNEKQAEIYTSDGLHLNDAGSERLGKQVAAFLQKNCNIEAGGKFYEVIGDAAHAYYCDNCLAVDTLSEVSFGGTPLPGVVKMSIDTSVYSIPLKCYMGSAPGWFGFKQADGTYKAVSVYAGARQYSTEGLETLTGDYWEFDSQMLNPANNTKNLWAAPSAMPSKIEVVLSGNTAKICFDNTEVYSVPCVELGYIASAVFPEIDGLTLTYAE